jgi:hypothetical protein
MFTRDLQLMPLMPCDFREIRYGDSCTLLFGTHKVSLVLKTFFVPILQELGTETFPNKVSINIKFCENVCWESHKFLSVYLFVV